MDVPARLKDLAVSETGFVFDPYSGCTFTANPTGLSILRDLKEGLERRDILANLGEHFEVRDGDLERDLDEFVQMLKRSGVVPLEFTVE